MIKSAKKILRNTIRIFKAEKLRKENVRQSESRFNYKALLK